MLVVEHGRALKSKHFDYIYLTLLRRFEMADSNGSSEMAECNAAGVDLSGIEVLEIKQEVPVMPVELHEVMDCTTNIPEKEENKSTLRQTENAVKTFRLYLRERNLPDDFENMTDIDLDQVLSKYYPEIRQENGERYQKSSLAAMRHGLNRYTTSKMGRDITRDPYFMTSQRVFKAVCKDLKKYGKDSVAHYPPIAKNDWVRMCKYFRDGDISQNVRLLQKVFVDLMMHFGKEIRKDFHQLQKTDFEVNCDEKGKLYVALSQRETPTDQWTYKYEKMHAKEGDPQCPVKSFIDYKSRLHPGTARLFQRPFQGNMHQHNMPGCWYSSTALGNKSLTAIMKKISKNAGLSRRYTTHSLRVTDPPDISTRAMEAMLKVLDDKIGQCQVSSDSESDECPLLSMPPKHLTPVKRFGNVSDDGFDVNKAVCFSRNNKTVRSNQAAAKQLRIFLKSINRDENFQDYELSELNEVLIQFFQNARKEDGEFYKVSTLKSFHFALNRYLKGPPHNKKFDLRFHPAFKTSNDALKESCTEFGVPSDEGIQYNPISENDMLKMYSSPLLNTDHPKGLFNKVHFELRMLVCGATFERFHNMEKDFFIVEEDELRKKRYVQKNRKKTNSLVKESFMYEISGSPYCPVASFELFLKKLNPGCNYLWQHALHPIIPENKHWYANLRCGEKMMSRFMTKLSQSCKLSQIYNNRHIRATDPNVLVSVLNRLNKARIVFVRNPITHTAREESSKRGDTATVALPGLADTGLGQLQSIQHSNNGLTSQQLGSVNQSLVSILPKAKASSYQIDPEWKKQVQNMDLSKVTNPNSMMLVPVKMCNEKDDSPEKKPAAKQGLSAKIMAQYRQIACKKSTVTSAPPTSKPLVNVPSIPHKTWSLVSGAGSKQTVFPSTEVVSSTESEELQFPANITPEGRKRAAVERPLTRSRTKMTKLDTCDNDRLKSVKMGNQIVFTDKSAKSPENRETDYTTNWKTLRVKLLGNDSSSSSSVPKSIELEQLTSSTSPALGSGEDFSDFGPSSSGIKIEIVDDSYGEDINKSIGCRIQDNQKINKPLIDHSESTEEEGFPLIMEVDDHVSLNSEDNDETSDDGMEDDSDTEDMATEMYLSKLSEDTNTGTIKQEAVEDSQSQLFLVPNEDIQYPTSTKSQDESTVTPIKQEVDTMEPSSLRTLLSAPPLTVHHVVLPQSNSDTDSTSTSVKDRMKLFLNKRQSSDMIVVNDDIIKPKVTKTSKSKDSKNEEKRKKNVKRDGHQTSVNNFSELLGSVNAVTGYQMFLQSKEFIRPSNDLFQIMSFRDAMSLIDNEWEELSSETKEWYESCAKTIRNMKLMEKQVQTETPICMQGNIPDTGVILESSSNATPCTDCKTQDKLIKNEKRIQELEKQLEQANNKNKELVRLALNLKGQLNLKIQDLAQ